MAAPETSSAKNKRKKIVDDVNADLDVKTKLARRDNIANSSNKEGIAVREAHEVIEVGSCCSSSSPRSSAGSDDADIDVTSCCSYNDSSELVEHGEVDPKEESDDEDSDQVESRSTYNPLIERREHMAPNSNNLGPQQTPVEGGGRGSMAVENAKMPTESELEEFFTTAEKVIQSKFSIKYNFDVTKHEALEGRYEWSRLKQ